MYLRISEKGNSKVQCRGNKQELDPPKLDDNSVHKSLYISVHRGFMISNKSSTFQLIELEVKKN